MIDFSSFSGGYYSLRMQVQPYEDGPAIEADLYDYIKRNVYAQTNAPITMKLSLDNGAYFNVGGEHGVPPSVLALPRAWVENLAEAVSGERQQVFVLKPEYSHIMHQREVVDHDADMEDFTDV